MDRNCLLRYFLALAIVFHAGTFGQLAAQVTASASFDPARVETGDTFSLRVIVKGVATAPREVDFSPWETLFSSKNILAQTGWNHSGVQWVQRFTLIAFDSATIQLPPLIVRLHLGDSIQTNLLELQVSPTPASAEPRDMDTIRDIRREPPHWTDFWPWGLAIATLLGALLWIVIRLTRRPKTTTVIAPAAPPPVPAHEIALHKLAALEHQKPWKNQQTEAYYADLSFILREYLEHRYDILALESTTREIAAFLKNTNFPDNLKAPLNYLLQQADMVKYAETPPPASYHEKALENAREVVMKTA